MAETFDWTITRGDSFNEPLTFKVWDAGTSAYVPVDLTGSTFTFTVKKDPAKDDTARLIQKVWSVHTDPTNGITTLELDPDETEVDPNPKPGWSADIQWEPAAGECKTIHGVLRVKQDVTKTRQLGG